MSCEYGNINMRKKTEVSCAQNVNKWEMRGEAPGGRETQKGIHKWSPAVRAERAAPLRAEDGRHALAVEGFAGQCNEVFAVLEGIQRRDLVAVRTHKLPAGAGHQVALLGDFVIELIHGANGRFQLDVFPSMMDIAVAEYFNRSRSLYAMKTEFFYWARGNNGLVRRSRLISGSRRRRRCRSRMSIGIDVLRHSFPVERLACKGYVSSTILEAIEGCNVTAFRRYKLSAGTSDEANFFIHLGIQLVHGADGCLQLNAFASMMNVAVAENNDDARSSGHGR